MTEWSKRDISLAKLMLALWNRSATIEDFNESCDSLMEQYAELVRLEAAAEADNQIEFHYQALLSMAGGDTYRLSKMLYAFILDSSPAPLPNTAPSKSSGRPADRWGRDGAGKLMLYFCIEDTMQKMRDEGITRPKIKDAAARLLEIPEQQRHRDVNMKKINDHASRYSEAKKILKGLR